MDIDPATPHAAQEFIDARARLFRAIDFDIRRGVSGNRIADWAASAVSRPIVQSYVAAAKLRADAHGLVKKAGLDGPLGVDITGEIGRGSRTVLLVLTADPAEIDQDPGDLVARATAAFNEKNIAIGVPEEHDSVVSALWEGDGAPLRRTKGGTESDREHPPRG
ncbi:hypothetical protein [Saccharothrix lopnurensis]|uniref:Uncharacterized protein n=1 Tax=Saccharothrix lopnurensis TaxID=1670621 RepID=A0ABW1PIY8_9PSEU